MKSEIKLGVHNGLLSDLPKTPNAVSSQSKHKDKHVEPLPMLKTAQETKSRILECLEKIDANRIQQVSDDYIYSVFISPIMRFKDDVEFYISESEKVVHFRSASRVGYSDLGANRRRYVAFKKLYLDEHSS